MIPYEEQWKRLSWTWVGVYVCECMCDRILHNTYDLPMPLKIILQPDQKGPYEERHGKSNGEAQEGGQHKVEYSKDRYEAGVVQDVEAEMTIMSSDQ